MDSVIFTNKINNALAEILKNYSQLFILTDRNTEKHCLPLLEFEQIEAYFYTIKEGEQHKNLKTLSSIWEAMTTARLDRHALMINLGGGVVGDMGGFAASTYKRGIDFVQIPTTLLAQVDASVGGKLGIDFMGLKNQIGAFKMPKATIIAPEFLKTLDHRQIKNGVAEMIKHAYIHSEQHLENIRNFNFQEIANPKILDLIKESVKIKTHFVENDPYEKGIRKALNFGHTFGHAFESYLLEKGTNIFHGEAVAQGMICELYLSNQLHHFNFDKLLEQIKFIRSIFTKIEIAPQEFEAIIGYLLQDKKNKNGKINFSLVSEVGKVHIDQYCTEGQINEALNFYFQFP